MVEARWRIMVSFSDFDVFALLGFGEATGMELVFAASALIGGGLFLVWFALMMIGGVAADIFDGAFGTDIEALGADASFKALTFQGIMAFLMFFGLAGLYTLKSDGTTSLAIIAGALAGSASMYGTGKLFHLFIGLQASGNIDISEAIGSQGTIYLRIPEGDVGQVQVEAGGALKIYNAKSEDGNGIGTGDFVEVVDVVSSTLIVKRV